MQIRPVTPALSYALGLLRSSEATIIATAAAATGGDESNFQAALRRQWAKHEREVAKRIAMHNTDSTLHRIDLIA